MTSIIKSFEWKIGIPLKNIHADFEFLCLFDFELEFQNLYWRDRQDEQNSSLGC